MKVKTKVEVNLNPAELGKLQRLIDDVRNTEGADYGFQEASNAVIIHVSRLINQAFDLGRIYQDEYGDTPPELVKLLGSANNE